MQIHTDANSFVAPHHQRAFRHLMMRRRHTLDELVEHRNSDSGKRRIRLLDIRVSHTHIENVHNLSDKQLLFERRELGPELEDAAENNGRTVRILGHKLRTTLQQLLVKLIQMEGLVQRHNHVAQYHVIVGLDWHVEALENGAKDLENLWQSLPRRVVAQRRRVHIAKAVVGEMLANRFAQRHKTTIDGVHNDLHILRLAIVGRAEQVDELLEELPLQVLLHRLLVNVGVGHHVKCQLINELQMIPRRITKIHLVVIRIRPNHTGVG
mmetsp:Transcript_479/g.891  ORF Transcript_479/g.891 Transcript_479/m.891 type:complete len:267 (-) Transcript_479:400-1200(-)